MESKTVRAVCRIAITTVLVGEDCDAYRVLSYQPQCAACAAHLPLAPSDDQPGALAHGTHRPGSGLIPPFWKGRADWKRSTVASQASRLLTIAGKRINRPC